MLNNYYDSLVMAESLGSEPPDPFPDQLFGVIYEPGGRSDPTWSPYEPGRGLVAVGNTITARDALSLVYDSGFLESPPPGFSAGGEMRIVRGSWRWESLP